MNPASIKATLQKKGQAMTLTRVSAGTYDPVTGNTTGATAATHTVHGIVTNYTTALKNAGDSLIQSGDRLATIEAVTVAPAVNDTLTIGGIVWKIMAIDPIDPAGTAYIYKCQIRK
jgi:hypothetical protein